jgi:DNA-binding transcriptional ArsR family regulator
MKIQKDNENDEILAEKREKSLITVSFLAAIKENLDPEKAFKISSDAFANYMISLYEDILASTEEYSQERFDCFRKFYEDLAYAFCLSDLTFTKKVLPGVKFSRNHEIARGGPYCDNTWEFNIVDK